MERTHTSLPESLVDEILYCLENTSDSGLQFRLGGIAAAIESFTSHQWALMESDSGYIFARDDMDEMIAID